MGVIRKQTIWGTVYTYLGAGLGVLTNLVLLAWFFSPEQIGLLNILIAYSLLFAQLANLGFDNVTTRMFPFFRDEQTKHHGFFGLLIRVLLVGALLAVAVFAVLYPFVVYRSNDVLLAKYGYYIFPLIVFTLLFNSLDAYSRVLYKSIRGTFLKEVFQRLLIIVIIGLYIFFNLSFDEFVFLYVLAISLPTIVLFMMLYLDRSVSYKLEPSFLGPELKKEMLSVSFFGIITVFSSTIVSNIDKIMIQQFLDLTQTGLYSIAFFFGVIITMPSRALSKISSIVVAEAWKSNDKKTIETVYYKSCINQMIFSLLLFIGIWANMENLLMLLPEKYHAIQWVVFWICLGSFIDMATGVNNLIIATSPKYKMQSFFMILFVVIIIVSNLIFIPLYRIEGAAFASALSMFLFNLIRWIYLWRKFNMQPFDFKFLLVIFLGLGVYLLSLLIPDFQPFYIDLIIRSASIFIVYVFFVLRLNLSEDITDRVQVYWVKLKSLMRKK